MKTTLTEREREILLGISEGLTNGQIGRSLFLSIDTVKTHCRSLYKKLGARDRANAVTVAFQTGLLIAAGSSELWRLQARLEEFARDNERLRKSAAGCSCPRPTPGKRELRSA